MKYYAIFGMGITGKAFLKYLEKLQAQDNNIQTIIGDNITEQEFINKLEAHTNKLEYVCIAPSVKYNSPLVNYLKEHNINYGTDISYTLSLINQDNLVAVTGSNGKSTITAWLAHSLGINPYGNIGTPLVNYLNNQEPYAICEMSSYQLYHDSLQLKPHIAIISNIMPDHIDWHETFEHYQLCKHSITQLQDSSDYLLIADKDVYNNIQTHAQKILITLDSSPLSLDKKIGKRLQELANNTNLIGDHNKLNALCVLVSLHLLNELNEQTIERFKNFTGLEYRLEYLGKTKNNIAVYNDSKATNPESTITALNSFKKEDNICLLLGGKDKLTDLQELISISQEKVQDIIFFGTAKERFIAEFEKHNYTGNMHTVTTLQEAYTLALTLNNIKNILFSPACSSFDQFKNYAIRGKIFTELFQQSIK